MEATVLITGVALALAIAPLACFVVWRRMAYFGDALAHSALLGIGFGVIVGVVAPLAIVLVAMLFVFGVTWLRTLEATRGNKFSIDIVLGIMAHASLAIGAIVLGMAGIDAHDMHDYLFGALDNVRLFDMGLMVMVAGLVLGVIAAMWSGLLLATQSEELASAEGVAVRAYEMILMLAMAVLVSVAVQMVGILPITALLIIPAASAQVFARSPEAMVVITALFVLVSIVVGLFIAQAAAIASGPPIVAVAVVIFTLTLAVRRLV